MPNKLHQIYTVAQFWLHWIIHTSTYKQATFQSIHSFSNTIFVSGSPLLHNVCQILIIQPPLFQRATIMANLSCVCPTDSVAPLAAFWLEGVALPSVGGLGLVGNVATIIVLRCWSIWQGKLSKRRKNIKPPICVASPQAARDEILLQRPADGPLHPQHHLHIHRHRRLHPCQGHHHCPCPHSRHCRWILAEQQVTIVTYTTFKSMTDQSAGV